MKCKVCKRAMIQLFSSWACDYCDGKTTEPISGIGYAKQLAWVALISDDGQEICGPGYQRVQVDWGLGKWGTVVEFPPATGIWGAVSEARLMDSEKAGKVILQVAFSSRKYVTSGDTLSVKFIL